MTTINTVPKGLQEFLGNTSQGKNPSILSPEVRANIDLFPFWAADKIKFRTTGGSVAAAFSWTDAVVPSGEIWIPISVSYDCTLVVAGELAQTAVALGDEAKLNFTYIATSDNRVADGIETVAAGVLFSTPVLLTAGMVIRGIMLKFAAGAARTTGLDVRYVLLKG